MAPPHLKFDKTSAQMECKEFMPFFKRKQKFRLRTSDNWTVGWPFCRALISQFLKGLFICTTFSDLTLPKAECNNEPTGADVAMLPGRKPSDHLLCKCRDLVCQKVNPNKVRNCANSKWDVNCMSTLMQIMRKWLIAPISKNAHNYQQSLFWCQLPLFLQQL